MVFLIAPEALNMDGGLIAFQSRLGNHHQSLDHEVEAEGQNRGLVAVQIVAGIAQLVALEPYAIFS